MKTLLASLLLCFCLVKPAVADSYNNGWRSMPFIQIMAAMMRAMNNMVGSNDSYSNFDSLPYSPAFFPLSGGVPGFSGFNNLPMSPASFSHLPMNKPAKAVADNLNTPDKQKNSNYGAADNYYSRSNKHAINSINGIWQSLSGDILAIYNNNRFLWSDGKGRNLAGYLLIKDNKMIAYIPAKQATLYFQFYKEPGQFIVRDTKGRIYTFKQLH